GRYLGHTAAESSRNIFLRFEQYAFYQDMNRRMEMARLIVRGKIDNQVALIRQHRFSDGYDWQADVKRMEELKATLPERDTPNEILGVEGICSNIYFHAFGHMLHGDFAFSGRNRRPPKDPVNVIISLAYTFLTKEMVSALDAESYETYLGFLHGIRYGRKSLALDMIEQFRQPVVDRLVLLLFAKRMLGRYDFEFPEEGGVVLSEDGFKKFCREYERWMNGTNSAAGDSFRARIRAQVAALKKSICDDVPYHPYIWKESKDVSGEL
ncbi:MAG: CRISPR-associated endonuclease Cas1, partial [Lachnospiraceae bacterium]|nr:CRISPR-associated endonuclease Cas1 [Lachnospiraceae bacterium]